MQSSITVIGAKMPYLEFDALCFDQDAFLRFDHFVFSKIIPSNA